MEFAFIIIGIAVGALIAWLFAKAKSGKTAARIEFLDKEIEQLKGQLDAATGKCDALSRDNNDLNVAVASASNNLDNMRKIVEEKAAEILQLKEDYKTEIEKINADHERRIATLKEEFAAEKERLIADFATQKADLHANFRKQLDDRTAADNRAIEALETKYREQIALQERQFREAIEKATEQLKNTTNEMLKERQEEFSKASNSNIGQILAPLRESMDKMKDALEKNNEKNTSLGDSLKDNITKLMEQTAAAKESADNLTNALRHQTKMQGDWGETVLAELLESQGLINGIHFDTQFVIRDKAGNVVKTDEGSSLRPDVILHLDTQRELIIDAKVSLSAYLDYVNAEDDASKAAALRRHIASINAHVEELSKKSYEQYIMPPKVSLDYVIMFVPNTGALWLALREQPDLWRRAMEKNVYIADEQTLYAAMRIVNMTWTQIRQGETHKRVFDIADEMLSRVNKLLNSFSAIGDSIKKAQDNYDSARKLITEGGQSIVTSANKLINLGAKVKKDSRNKLSVYLTDVAEVAPLELPQDSETPTDEPDNNE